MIKSGKLTAFYTPSLGQCGLGLPENGLRMLLTSANRRRQNVNSVSAEHKRQRIYKTAIASWQQIGPAGAIHLRQYRIRAAQTTTAAKKHFEEGCWS